MGREAVAVAHWNGAIAEVKALLESSEIILRGEIRAKIPRATISSFTVDDDVLSVTSSGQVLRLDLGQAEATKWAAVLSKPLPTLAQKLGISPSRKAFVMGRVQDVELSSALTGAQAHVREDATVLIAIIQTEADLADAIICAQNSPTLPLWCVYGKGKFATVTDSAIRSTMRESGFVDNKTSGISDKLTATRYQLRAGS
jgi:hypothetical protein